MRTARNITQVELPKVDSEYEAWFDGACWPNQNGIVRWRYSEYLGTQDTSNNVAEYAGLIAVLKYLSEGSISQCVIYGDSNLVIKQMNKEWKAGKLTRKEKSGKIPIRARYYLPWFEMAMNIRKQITTELTFRWTPREKNVEADALSTEPLIKRGIRNPF
jgi:ribonuclease HI